MLLDFRDAVFDAVHKTMSQDKDALILYNDMGAMGIDKIRANFPNRVINVGIAEQNMMSVAAGLALAGKCVFTYGIAAHITARCYEQIKLDICSMHLPVIILGIGSGLSYGVDGPTHQANEDIAIMRALPGMTIYNPADAITATAVVNLAYHSHGPAYIRMDKEQHEAIYNRDTQDFTEGLATVAFGGDVTIIATGILVHRAIAVSEELAKDGVSVRVVDLYRIKPCNTQLLRNVILGSKRIVTLEEHSSVGGIGSLIADLISESGVKVPFTKLSLSDETYLGSASRAWAHERCGLTVDGIVSVLKGMVCAETANTVSGPGEGARICLR